MSDPMPPAIVLGLSPTGLHVVRTLGRKGVRVIGVAEGAQAGAASRYLDQCIRFEDDASLLDTLLAASRQSGDDLAPILIPTSDRFVQWVIDNSSRLSGGFRFQPSYSDGTAQAIMAKNSFDRLCRENGVAVPRTWETSADVLASEKDSFALPCMIKPAEIHRVKEAMAGRKGWVARTPDEVVKIAGQVPDGAGRLLVQEIVQGPESAITLACAYLDGEDGVRQLFTARKLRQFPPGFGSASLVQSAEEEETARIFVDLLSAVGYRGIAAGEFKRDPKSGKLKIIEINVRPSLWFSISESANRPVVYAAYRALAGLAPVAEEPQIQGVRWRYLLKDLYSAVFYLRRKDFVLPAPEVDAVGAASNRTSPVMDLSDAKPVLAESWNFLQKALLRFTSQARQD